MLKITVPVHDPADCDALIEAGAGEFYCGLASPAGYSLNYREAGVREAHLPGPDQLRQVAERASRRGIPVHLCINSYQAARGVELQLEQAAAALRCGVAGFVIADFSLIPELRRLSPGSRIIISTAASCSNSRAAELYSRLGADRVVLERQLTLTEISSISAAASAAGLETEVFIKPGGCPQTNGYCRMHGIERDPRFCGAGSSDEPGVLCRGSVRFGAGGSGAEGGHRISDCALCALYYLAGSSVAGVKIEGRQLPSQLIRKYVRMVSGYLSRLQEGLITGENFTAAGSRLRSVMLGNACTADNCFYYEVRKRAFPSARR